MQYAERLPCVSTTGCLATVNRCMLDNGDVTATDGALWDQHGQSSTGLANGDPTPKSVASVTGTNVTRTTATYATRVGDTTMQGVQTGLSSGLCSFNEFATKTSMPSNTLSESQVAGDGDGVSGTGSCAASVSEAAETQLTPVETRSLLQSCDAGNNSVSISPSSLAATDAHLALTDVLSVDVDSRPNVHCTADCIQPFISQAVSSSSQSPNARAPGTSVDAFLSVTTSLQSQSAISQLVSSSGSQCGAVTSSSAHNVKSPVASPLLGSRSPIASSPNVQTITLYTITSSPSHKSPPVDSHRTVLSLPSMTTGTDVTPSTKITQSKVSLSCTQSVMSSCVDACGAGPVMQPALDSLITASTSGADLNKGFVTDMVSSSGSSGDGLVPNSASDHGTIPTIPSIGICGETVAPTVTSKLATMVSVAAESSSAREDNVLTVLRQSNSSEVEKCVSLTHQVTVRPKSLNDGQLVEVKESVVISNSTSESRDLKPDHIDDRLSTGSLDLSQPHLRRSDRHSVSSITSDTRSCAGPLQNSDVPTFMAVDRGLSLSQGIEKLLDRTASSHNRSRSGYENGQGVVRSSWSQENYFDHNDLTCVDIELDDDDDLASSVDVLHYLDGSTSSNVSLSGQLPSHSWTEDDIGECGTSVELASGKLRSWAPLVGDVFAELASGSTELTDSKQVSSAPAVDFKRKSPPVQPGLCIALAVDSDDVASGFSTDNEHIGKQELNKAGNLMLESTNEAEGEPLIPSSELPVLATRPTTKDVDRPSAARLAKRLFYLHGFRRADVLRHLTKRNSFSQLVGEEFLKFFDFTSVALDTALRQFVKHLAMSSELQDRDQLLLHFAHRYYECNSDTYKSEDCCHTLACAIVLLNSDLHCQTASRPMSLLEFITNLAEMNEGGDFPEDMLMAMYESIKEEPLQYQRDDSADSSMVNCGSVPVVISSPRNSASSQPRYTTAGFSNPFLETPTDSDSMKEYKKGYVMRKSCVEPDGRKTPLGKRGWKMFYLTLRDMTLCMYNDENSYKRATHCSNTIRIHHSLATKAGDYVKKKHVFRLQTADLAQYLIQTSDSRECQEWMDTINFIAASYSAPSQFEECNITADIGSQKRFQRPLLPLSYTTLNLKDQIGHQEKMIAQFERELLEHRKDPPEKGARSRIIHEYCKKEAILKFELKRYKTYVRLLQYKLAAFSELEPSLVETVIGEVDEPSTSPSHATANVHFNLDLADRQVCTENLSIVDAVLDTVHEV